MLQEEKELLEKFSTLTRWMYEDAKKALFPPAMATFVVATALFDFIEICGLFLIGPKDSTSKLTSSSARFNAFFDYLGPEYSKLRNDPLILDVYKELRCGMSHEGLVKNRDFCILGSHKEVSDDMLRNNYYTNHTLLTPHFQRLTCGVIFNGSWIITVGILLIHFQDAVQKLIKSIEDGSGDRRSFFEAANHIGLSRFKIEKI